MKHSETGMPLTPSLLLLSAILLLSTLNPVNGLESARKLGDKGEEEKCTPCGQTPPPPPPPSPCPPPPSPPPPPKKPPSPSSTSPYCPPPPAVPFIYITGPPGQQLYPIDQDLNYNNGAANAKSGPIMAFGVLIGLCGILAF